MYVCLRVGTCTHAVLDGTQGLPLERPISATEPQCLLTFCFFISSHLSTNRGCIQALPIPLALIPETVSDPQLLISAYRLLVPNPNVYPRPWTQTEELGLRADLFYGHMNGSRKRVCMGFLFVLGLYSAAALLEVLLLNDCSWHGKPRNIRDQTQCFNIQSLSSYHLLSHHCSSPVDF